MCVFRNVRARVRLCVYACVRVPVCVCVCVCLREHCVLCGMFMPGCYTMQTLYSLNTSLIIPCFQNHS